MVLGSYVPLWNKSNYSFLEGASHPEELVERAHELGLPALSITDRDGVYGVVRAHLRAEKLGIKLLIGAQLTVTLSTQEEGKSHPVVLLAMDRRGYGSICQLISKGRSRCEKGQALISVDELCAAADPFLVLTPAPALLPILQPAFAGRLYALWTRHLSAHEQPTEQRLRDVAQRMGVPLVAAVEVLYHSKERQPLHDVLTCIRHGVTLASAGAVIRPNAEHHLKSAAAMQELFADEARAVERTLEVAARCDFSLTQIRYRYPAERLPDGRNEKDWLRQLTLHGAQGRYGGAIPADVLAQLERELCLIHELDYGGYFLTMWEIVQFCRRANILCQGRGSAANSAVCYCLGITAVDPVRMDLLFERFLSRERAEPPDIDLDIEHERREEVIQWVYERYGRRHAAMVANVIRYRTRSAVREVGKVLGVPLTALDRLSKLLAHGHVDPRALIHAGLDPAATVHQHLLQLSEQIQDFPRHLSIHPGGFLLGHEPVDTLVPIEPGTMEGRTVIQWDKQDIEDLGLFKVDLLGLGALTHVHACFDLLREHRGIALRMATVDQEDRATYEMIARGDSVGLFQIESRAQMAMLPRLRPSTFYDLVIEVAIVRPGPIQGDMVHPYLRRRTGQEPVEYPHPSLERVLSKTLGVPIFQEQVMKLAVLAADYTPGEADGLRRDMAAWRSSGRIEQHRERLISRMVAKGIPEPFAQRVFAQIRGFGEYGFPESHAASFAHIAYVTAWLKCHHHDIFTCGLLNAQPMGFYSVSTLVEDAKRHGVTVLPIDINHSAWRCTLEPTAHPDQLAIRMGLRFVKGLGQRERSALERAAAPYPSLNDVVCRTGLSRAALLELAEAGAFTSLGLSRRDALWQVRKLHQYADDTLGLRPARHRVSEQMSLFRPLSRSEAVMWDYRRAQHSARGHPMQILRAQLRERGCPDARTLNGLPDGKHVEYVGLVICRQRPRTASGVTFFTLEDESGFMNLVVWRPTFERYALIAKTAALMGVRGKIQSESGVVHVIAQHLWLPEATLNTEGVRTRSFH